MLLAGGAAQRFGGLAKGLALVEGTSIADRALQALRFATDAQVVVCNDPRAARWFPELPVFADAIPGRGPLAGIETGLRAARGAAIVVVAWDMPFVTGPLVRTLRARGEKGADCVVPAHGDPPVLEPLCAWYGAGALLTCSQLLSRGERRAHALFEALAGRAVVNEDAMQDYGSAARLFLSVDSAAKLEELGGIMPGE
ncbi:MAG: Molybdopterin-guanine dinucleotide biosynthesis protein [Gemmatimonadetes bacterium]|nr:Molybdopterin-guanine dinucleotide biosynthesis protein [Gemmatimonadota bacterium]